MSMPHTCRCGTCQCEMTFPEVGGVSIFQAELDHRTEITRLQDQVNELKIRLRPYEAFAELIGESVDTMRAAQRR